MTPVWTRQALADLAEIVAYIASDDPAAATRLLERIDLAGGETLPAHPQLGKPGRVEGTREFVVHPSYILVYRLRDVRLEILAVRHSAQRWPEHFPDVL